MSRTNIPNIYSVYMFALYRTFFRLSIENHKNKRHFQLSYNQECLPQDYIARVT